MLGFWNWITGGVVLWIDQGLKKRQIHDILKLKYQLALTVEKTQRNSKLMWLKLQVLQNAIQLNIISVSNRSLVDCVNKLKLIGLVGNCPARSAPPKTINKATILIQFSVRFRFSLPGSVQVWGVHMHFNVKGFNIITLHSNFQTLFQHFTQKKTSISAVEPTVNSNEAPKNDETKATMKIE